MSEKNQVNRRDFLKNTAAALAASQAFAVLPSFGQAPASGKKYKIALIGCGGRGSGALNDHLEAAKTIGSQCEIVGLADYFDDRVKGTAKKHGISDDKVFVGASSYKKIVEGPAEIVLVATPPAFRAVHFEALVKAGKHVFAEKPVACDPPNIRRWFAASDESVKKGLCMVAGTQRRHQEGYLKNAKALADGAIGKLVGGQVYWCGTVPWVKPQEAGQSDAHYMLRNWLAFQELSGDHIVEQHVHNLDIANWYLGRPPVSAVGFGGRHRRKTGNVYDIFSVDFDWGDDVHIHSMCRQISGTYGSVREFFTGTEGVANGSGKISRYDKKEIAIPDIKVAHNNPYVQEHIDLLNAIASGKQLNEAHQVGQSTATAILGRMATYTGEMIRYVDMISNEKSKYYNLTLTCSPTDFETNEAGIKAPPDGVAPLQGTA